jgi:hypothetical protein
MTNDNAKYDRIDAIVIAAAQSGIALNAGRLKDDERCRDQMALHAAGYRDVKIGTNVKGFCVFPVSNLHNHGMRISENYATREEAVAWAREYVAADPSKRRLVVFRHFPNDRMMGEWIEE